MLSELRSYGRQYTKLEDDAETLVVGYSASLMILALLLPPGLMTPLLMQMQRT